MWLYRFLLLCFLCISFPVMAQDSAEEKALMFERIQEAYKSYLTQADVDVFVKVYKTSKSLKETNRTKWDEIENASMEKREEMINEVSQLKPGESFFVSAFRVTVAYRASDPEMVAEAKKEYEKMKTYLPELEKQMEKMSETDASVMRNQIKATMETMKQISDYPAQNLKVYTVNQQIITEAMNYFESQ